MTVDFHHLGKRVLEDVNKAQDSNVQVVEGHDGEVQECRHDNSPPEAAYHEVHEGVEGGLRLEVSPLSGEVNKYVHKEAHRLELETPEQER